MYYDSPVGSLPAYISKPGDRAAKYPAIVWLVGGFSNSIGPLSWSQEPIENDQSASVFWQKGIVTMYPSMRGGNMNPGYIECLYGEVDDVIAAARYLQKLPYVDPKRIYLGGHSTGGTLALLVAESTALFRGVFSFGPIDDPAGYGQQYLTYDINNKTERTLRSPIAWLDEITTPTVVFEGIMGNIESLHAMKNVNKNLHIHFYSLEGYNHFDIIYPISSIVADKIIADTDVAYSISFTTQELHQKH